VQTISVLILPLLSLYVAIDSKESIIKFSNKGTGVDNMSKRIGEKFKIGQQEFIVDNADPIDPKLARMIEAMQKTGKDAVLYFASKVLKSGKKSVQGGMFYRFTESGNYIKVI
jgi:hypothetical protein